MAITEPQDEVVASADPGKGLPGRVTMPGSTTQLGPLGHLADERRRLADLTWDYFEVTPQSATIGAEIHGIDLREELSDEVFADVQRALWEYKVIFFRDQPIPFCR